MTEARRGVWAMVACCLIWGFSPILYKELGHVPSDEVLAHRGLWSLVLFGALLAVQGRLVLAFGLLRRHPVAVTVASLLVSLNWWLFIHSVQIGRTLDVSLGYFLFPLVVVVLGRVVFGERLRAAQWVAVGLAALAVAGLTVGLGVVPVIALSLAVSFGLYGAMKRRVQAGPVVSVTAEVILLAPLVLGWLLAVHLGAVRPGEGAGVGFWGGFGGGWFGRDTLTSLLLVLAGAMTAGPLILFSYASKRITMATLGLVQYLNPFIQFLCGVLIFAEPFSALHGAAFAVIWVGLALYSLDAVRQERAARRRAASAATSGTTAV